MRLRTTRIRDLVALAVVAAVVVWTLAHVIYGSLPRIPIYAGASLYVLAAIEVVLAFVIRIRVANRELGTDPRQLHPITAARALALAKASAVVGALSAGVWAGFWLYLFPQRSLLRSATLDSPGALVGVIAGIVLAAAALWLEHCCKAPPEPPEDPAH